MISTIGMLNWAQHRGEMQVAEAAPTHNLSPNKAQIPCSTTDFPKSLSLSSQYISSTCQWFVGQGACIPITKRQKHTSRIVQSRIDLVVLSSYSMSPHLPFLLLRSFPFPPNSLNLPKMATLTWYNATANHIHSSLPSLKLLPLTWLEKSANQRCPT